MEEDPGLKTDVCVCFYFLRREKLNHVLLQKGESVDRNKVKIQE